MGLTKAEANRINGAKGGRPPGRKNNKTIEKNVARQAYEQMVLENLNPIFRKQLLLSMGQTFVYRKEKHGTGASMRIEHVLLDNPHEIADALDVLANYDSQDDDGFVYITTKSPESRAIDSMLDRTLGKATQKVEHTGENGGPIEITGVEITVRK